MKITFFINDQIVERARRKAAAKGKSLNQVVRDYLRRLAGRDDPKPDNISIGQ